MSPTRVPFLVFVVCSFGACSAARTKPSHPHGEVATLTSDERECVLPDGTRAPAERPELRRGEDPTITRAAIDARVEGTSIAECTIRRNGEVTDCDMVQSVPATDALVLEMVTAWKMEPVRCGGVPTDARYRIPLRFWIRPPRPRRQLPEGVLKDCPNGEMAKPRIISGEAPRFSAQAREARVWGTAIVQCVLRKTGALTDCWVVRRLPYMDEELLRAFSTWKVEPARCGGEPIDLWYNIPIRIPLRETMPLGSSGELSDR